MLLGPMTQKVGRPLSIWQDGDVFSLSTVEDAHLTCSPGAGHYLCTDKDTGEGVKQSISVRHKEGIHAGYPNPLVQPVDTHGRWGIVLEFIVYALLHNVVCPVQGLLRQVLATALLQCVDLNTAVAQAPQRKRRE